MKILFSFLFLISSVCYAQPKTIRIVFTSDVHFGLKRKFRGADSVNSIEVNRAMAASMGSLGKIDAIIITGDIANEETVATLRQTGAPCVEKPFRVQQFISVIEKTMGKAS